MAPIFHKKIAVAWVIQQLYIYGINFDGASLHVDAFEGFRENPKTHKHENFWSNLSFGMIYNIDAFSDESLRFHPVGKQQSFCGLNKALLALFILKL